jgi:hypothetical protein
MAMRDGKKEPQDLMFTVQLACSKHEAEQPWMAQVGRIPQRGAIHVVEGRPAAELHMKRT